MKNMESRHRRFKKSVRDLITYFKEGCSRRDEAGKRSGIHECGRAGEADQRKLEKQMKKAAAELNFEAAAELRDKMIRTEESS